jgi:hypothetical protein
MHRRRLLVALTALAAPAISLIAAGAGAQPLALVYEGSSGGVSTRLVLRLDGSRVEGTLHEQGLALPVRGTVEGRRMQAAVLDPGTGAALVRIAGELRDEGVQLSARPEGGGTGRTLAMRRVPADAPAAAGSAAGAGGTGGQAVSRPDGAGSPGRTDPALVGRWTSESQLQSSGGAGGFAALSTVRTLELAGDGRVRQWVRTAGGGGNWTADGGQRLEFSGRWETRGPEIWVRQDGQPGFVRAATYRFSGEYLLTDDGSGRRIWRR